MKTNSHILQVRIAATRGRGAVLSVALAACLWLPLAVRADDPSSANAPVSPTLSAAVADKPDSTAGAAGNSAKIGPINSMDDLDDRHKLAIGDHLSFRIIEDEDEPKDLAVTVSGDIEVPYVGLYRVVGRTCKQVAQKLKIELEKKYYYHATVILAVTDWARSQGKVYLVGPVHSPGPQEIPSDEVLTLSKAIMRAGGFSDFADRHKVELRRKSDVPGGKEQVFTVDVGLILDKGKMDSDMPLKDLDVIYIPERLVRF